MTQVSATSSRQSTKIEAIHHLIGAIDRGMQRNTGLIEEAAGSAKALEKQAAALAELVKIFNLGSLHHLQHGSRD